MTGHPTDVALLEDLAQTIARLRVPDGIDRPTAQAWVGWRDQHDADQTHARELVGLLASRARRREAGGEQPLPIRPVPELMGPAFGWESWLTRTVRSMTGRGRRETR